MSARCRPLTSSLKITWRYLLPWVTSASADEMTTGERQTEDIDVKMMRYAKWVLYPLSAFRAMNKAALTVYQNILEKGDQKDVVDLMQTRMELYDFLNYHDFEQKLDQLFAQKKD